MAPPAFPSYANQTDSQRPFVTPQDYYRLRDFGQKFEATIGFLRRHGGNLYRVLLMPLLLALVPLVLFALLFGYSASVPLLGRSPTDTLLLLVPGLLGLGLLILAAMMGQYVMVYGFVKCRMHQPDAATPLSAAEVWAEGKRHLLRVIGYGIVGYGVVLGAFMLVLVPVVYAVSRVASLGVLGVVLVFFVFLLLLIPGMYLSVIILLLPCVVVFEEGDLVTTFRRCLTLIKGKWWSTFGLYMVASMAISMVAGGLGVVITLSTTILNLKDPNPSAVVVGMAVAQAVQLGIYFLLYPVLHVLVMFQYFNLVERHDHVSLQWQAELLGQAPGGAVPLPAAPDDTLFRPSYGDQAL